jgi:hypothetical protein
MAVPAVPQHWDWTRTAGGLAAIAAVLSACATGLPALLRWWRRWRHLLSEEPPPVEFATRSAFIERVWAQRIVNGLERSLQHATEMQLGLRNEPDLLVESYDQSTAAPGEVLTIDDAYQRSGRQLVILGPPGSGKTAAALRIMRDMLETARRDPAAAVPELFPLASWAKKRKALGEWMADQLHVRHGRPMLEARSLLSHHQVVPVLDGLDEVAEEHREACLQEINRFWEGHAGAPLVVCSRVTEYRDLGEGLKLGGAAVLCPPDSTQIQAYLEAAGPAWDSVRAELRQGTSRTLQELLATPLMLSVAVLAYQGADPSELCADDETATGRKRLWSRYISTMVTRGYDPVHSVAGAPAYTEAQVRPWLMWLAKEMSSRNETELWLHECTGPRAFRIGVKAVSGLLVMAIGLASFVGIEFIVGRYSFTSVIVPWIYEVPLGLVVGLKASSNPTYRKPFDGRGFLIGALAVAIGASMLHLAPFGTLHPAAPLGQLWLLFLPATLLFLALMMWLHASVRDAVFALAIGTFVYLAASDMAFQFQFLTHGGQGLSAIGTVMIAGLGGILVGLLALGVDPERRSLKSTTQLIRDSGRTGILAGLVITVVLGFINLIGSYPLDLGTADKIFNTIFYCVAFSLVFGLDSVIFHYAFRLRMRRRGGGPLRWVRFLDWATDHLLLTSTGASYQWIHLELRDYLVTGHSPGPIPPVATLSVPKAALPSQP